MCVAAVMVGVGPGDGGSQHLPPMHPINLRKQVNLSLDPSFSVKSYVGAASTLLDKAQMADAQGHLEMAFIHYLTAASVASFVPKHAEWPSIKQQRGATFQAYQELMNRTPEIVKRANAIESELTARAEDMMRDAQREKHGSGRHSPAVAPAQPLLSATETPTIPHGRCLSVEELWTYMYPGFDRTTDTAGHELLSKRRGPQILLVDIRPRSMHAAGHIRGADTICIEPTVLRAPPVSMADLQASLPPKEAAYLEKRSEYDLLVLYDQRTRALSSGGNATPEQEHIESVLRTLEVDLVHSPCLLRGGFESWARQVGDSGVIRERGSSAKPASPATPSARRTAFVTPSVPPRTYQVPVTSGKFTYPDITSLSTPRMSGPTPPPAARTPMPASLMAGPSIMSRSHSMAPPSFPVPRDVRIGLTGLCNFGQTCYMNATIQCLSATMLLAQYMLDGTYQKAINTQNPLGTRGALSHALAALLRALWSEQSVTVAPTAFREAIGQFAPAFRGHEQQDSQEFLLFLLDGLHEDLNRIVQRPPALELGEAQQAELSRLPQQLASVAEWSLYRRRNDSVIVDTFQGQLRNQLTCLTCGHMSVTYNAFMSLSLPVPCGRGVSQATLYQCMDAFVHEEVLDKGNAWHCPKCQRPRRSTKRLSLARLPPVLLIHLKRFTFRGPASNKIETRVNFPFDKLDLSNYMPPPLPPGMSVHGIPVSESQRPPYLYDLHAVTHHFGTLNSGHYTASVRTQGLWYYCDDSRVTPSDAQLHTSSPYMLFFSRRASPL